VCGWERHKLHLGCGLLLKLPLHPRGDVFEVIDEAGHMNILTMIEPMAMPMLINSTAATIPFKTI